MRSPGRPKDAPGDTVERILRAATTLFADRGLHGASTREIAAAAGLNIATLSYHLGSKAELYRAVFQRLAAEERALVDAAAARADAAALASPEALRELLGELIDALLAQAIERPETSRLWVRRWLERPSEAEALEAEVSAPLYRQLHDLIARAQAAGSVRREGLDIGLCLQGFSWMLYGYMVGGPLDGDARADPADPGRLAAFRAFLHDYMCRMLGIPDR